MSNKQDNIIRRVPDAAVNAFCDDIQFEYFKARGKFGPIGTPHEGLSVLNEEVKEVTDLVYSQGFNFADFRKELLQVATMAMAMALECDPAAIPWLKAVWDSEGRSDATTL